MPHNLLTFVQEIQKMSRVGLIAAKNDLLADSEIPRKEKGQLIVEIDKQLSTLKTKKKQESGFFCSFMVDGEAVSCISPLSVGDFIVQAEPDALISVFALSAEQYAAMKEKEWEEFV
jgi:hypothetical protein